MTTIKPFRGYRPIKEKVHQIVSKPYDVLNDSEARSEAFNNDYSFYHIIKPEINFPVGYSSGDSLEKYYSIGERFRQFIQEGIFFRDEDPYLYVYRQTAKGRSQTGLIACSSIKDLLDGKIKKHELTRKDKEEDRAKHIEFSELNAEPVFIAYPPVDAISQIIETIVKKEPEYDFTTEDYTRQTFWIIKDKAMIDELVELFATKVSATYIADGHHRTAAATIVYEKGLKETEVLDTKSYFLTALFPGDQLQIIDYNRLVKDFYGHSAEEILSLLEKHFELSVQRHGYKPAHEHSFGMYMNGKWYKLEARPDSIPGGNIESMDVSILSKYVLEDILGITDQRNDPRIDFVGGVRGLKELEMRVDSGEMKLAFTLYPVSMEKLYSVADAGLIMPPKSTWFEPKLRSGLVVYSFN